MSSSFNLWQTALVALCLLMQPAWAADSATPERTVTGVVDGQKFGTNVLGDGTSVTFEADSANEARLLKACDVGTRCKVVVVTNKSDVVVRLVSAERLLGTQPSDAQPTSIPAAGPSFSCAKAGPGAERMICDDAALASLDRELTLAYKRNLDAATAERMRLQKEQRDWIRGKRDTCVHAECLRAAYQDRIKALNR